MLLEELDKAWREREGAVSLEGAPTFRREGLVLGAGAVLIGTDKESGRLLRLDGAAENRLLVLLSAAYGRRVGPEALGHVRRAAARWSEGNAAFASLHLALAGLGPLSNPRGSSRRLFLADRLIEAGADPDTLLRALDFGAGPNTLARAYNPNEPRVPAGSGRPSGQWISGDATGTSSDQSEPAAAPPPSPAAARGRPPSESPGKAPSAEDAGVDALAVTVSPSQEAAARAAAERALKALRIASKVGLEGLSDEELISLGGLAATLVGPTVFLGVLLTPTNKTIDSEQPVPGWPRFFYEHLPGEVGWRVTYVNDRGEGVEVSAGPDGMYRDAHGQAFARLLPTGALLFASSGTLPERTKHDTPEVCPLPTPDKFGQGPGSRSKAYENQMKPLLNPEAPTPPDHGRALAAPFRKSAIVIFDDCWLLDGDMFEYKGPGYAGLIKASRNSAKLWNFEIRWLNDSLDQVRAAQPGRRVVWMFAEPESAQFAYDLFKREDQGREKIIVGVFPYLGD